MKLTRCRFILGFTARPLPFPVCPAPPQVPTTAPAGASRHLYGKLILTENGTYLTYQLKSIVIEQGTKANLPSRNNTLPCHIKVCKQFENPQLSVCPVGKRGSARFFLACCASTPCVFVELPEHMASYRLPPPIEHNVQDACLYRTRFTHFIIYSGISLR